MENRIRELASQVQALKTGSIRPRYPAALKQEILTLYRGSGRRMQLLGGLGLGHTTIAAWLKSEAAASKLPAPTFKSFL